MQADHPAVQERMVELELHGDELSIGEFMAHVLDVEHDDAFDDVAFAQVRRSATLLADYVRRGALPMESRSLATIAFLQGITFAVAVQQLEAS